MIYPEFATRSFRLPLMFGSIHPNNELVKWYAYKKVDYLYCNYKTNLFVTVPNIGWMRFGNNPAIKTSLYINMIVMEEKCKGHGTKQMDMLKQFSEETKTPLSLICCAMHGSDPDRLSIFYKRLGFIPNNGFYIYDKMEAA